jgi:hypothetical protein
LDISGRTNLAAKEKAALKTIQAECSCFRLGAGIGRQSFLTWTAERAISPTSPMTVMTGRKKIMLSLPTATRAIHTDAGNELNLSYYILVEENKDGLETYGVQVVENESGNSASVLGITMDGDMIESLVEMLERNAVTPVSLPDVLADWLV